MDLVFKRVSVESEDVSLQQALRRHRMQLLFYCACADEARESKKVHQPSWTDEYSSTWNKTQSDECWTMSSYIFFPMSVDQTTGIVLTVDTFTEVIAPCSRRHIYTDIHSNVCFSVFRNYFINSRQNYSGIPNFNSRTAKFYWVDVVETCIILLS